MDGDRQEGEPAWAGWGLAAVQGEAGAPYSTRTDTRRAGALGPRAWGIQPCGALPEGWETRQGRRSPPARSPPAARERGFSVRAMVTAP